MRVRYSYNRNAGVVGLIAFCFLWIAGVVCSLAVPAVVLYIVWHFAHKYW